VALSYHAWGAAGFALQIVASLLTFEQASHIWVQATFATNIGQKGARSDYSF
jgi:hypothetical protein